MTTTSAATVPTPADPTAGLADLFTVDSAESRATISARTPILFTPAGEPYLPLPAPFERFVLSPERVSDVPDDIAMMSDIRVARTLVGPPFPVLPIASQRWLVRERKDVTALFAAYAEGTFLPASCDPFSVLRERRPDGTEVYVGQVTVMYEGPNEKRRTPVNEAWEAWRSREKVWGIGAALRPEYHRQGIASAAVGVIMHQWAIPQMGCTELRAECLKSNVGSVKIWEKYGFVEDPELRTEVTITEAKGGGIEQGCALVWHLK
ncbi:hypothetical protein B0H19DRAFT_1152752 [Mycena capillaripes]|nr:hypothetical protein B0H19DRAFT_1152752 [Mycena capillaripes]